MGAYILSVISAALVLGIVSSLLDSKSTAGALVKLIGSLYLTVVIIQPLVQFDLDAISTFLKDFSIEAEAASSKGTNLGRDTMGNIIKEETCAYILDKAGLYNASVSVEVTVTDESIPVPKSVTIRGSVSPYAKKQLQKIIEDDLAIPMEDQLWIGTS